MSSWIKACEADEIDEEDVVPFISAGKEFAIYRSEDDEFYASDAFCTHEQQRLCDGLVMDGVIECPKHNGRFDFRTGKALGAPVITGLRMYPVRVEDGIVMIDVDG